MTIQKMCDCNQGRLPCSCKPTCGVCGDTDGYECSLPGCEFAKPVAMTTNQTIDGVPRAKLEQALKLAAVFDDGGDGADAESSRSVVGILRALLDMPVLCAHEWESPVLSSMPDYCAKCAIDKPAAQPQGEPVAMFYVGDIDGYGCLYTEPQADALTLYPAPVAVVLPERKSLLGLCPITDPEYGLRQEWNYCIAEAERLNSVDDGKARDV